MKIETFITYKVYVNGYDVTHMVDSWLNFNKWYSYFLGMQGFKLK